jgi:hypothetical protein
MIRALVQIGPRRGVASRVAGVAAVAVVLAALCFGCAADEAMNGGPGASPTQNVTPSPGVRLSGDQFWATLSPGDRASICQQVLDDPKAALDIAASYAAANPVFRSQLVATIRSECA